MKDELVSLVHHVRSRLTEEWQLPLEKGLRPAASIYLWRILGVLLFVVSSCSTLILTASVVSAVQRNNILLLLGSLFGFVVFALAGIGIGVWITSDPPQVPSEVQLALLVFACWTLLLAAPAVLFLAGQGN